MPFNLLQKFESLVSDFSFTQWNVFGQKIEFCIIGFKIDNLIILKNYSAWFNRIRLYLEFSICLIWFYVLYLISKFLISFIVKTLVDLKYTYFFYLPLKKYFLGISHASPTKYVKFLMWVYSLLTWEVSITDLSPLTNKMSFLCVISFAFCTQLCIFRFPQLSFH